MERYYGVLHYFDHDLRSQPDVVVDLLVEALAEWPGIPGSVQGMFAGRDRFSRARAMSPRNLSQLRVDVSGGVFSNVSFSIGAKESPWVVGGLDVTPRKGLTRYPTCDLAVRCISHEDEERALRLAHRAWEAVTPLYGLGVWGPTFNTTVAEVTGIPISSHWQGDDDDGDEERLFRIQELAHRWGEYAREAAWGMYLGASLVERLGGYDTVRRGAPVSKVQPLPPGGAYLQLTEEPAVLGSREYGDGVRRLRGFLQPVLPPELQESCLGG